jgi:hypothetical protein
MPEEISLQILRGTLEQGTADATQAKPRLSPEEAQRQAARDFRKLRLVAKAWDNDVITTLNDHAPAAVKAATRGIIAGMASKEAGADMVNPAPAASKKKFSSSFFKKLFQKNTSNDLSPAREMAAPLAVSVNQLIGKNLADEDFRAGVARLLRDNAHVHLPLGGLSATQRAIVLGKLCEPEVVPNLKNVVLDLSPPKPEDPIERLPADFAAVLQAIRTLGEKGDKRLNIEVDLSRHQIGNEEGAALAQALAGSKVSKLSLRRGSMSADAVTALTAALPNASALTHLDLDGHHSISRNIEKLTDVLPRCHLTDLNLARCGLDAQGMSLLATAIRQPATPLRALALEGNVRAHLGDGFVSLFNALRQSKLETLDVSGCWLGTSDAALDALKRALASPATALRTLRLRNNSLNSNGWMPGIVLALTRNRDSKLRALDLSENSLQNADLLLLVTNITGKIYLLGPMGLPGIYRLRLADLRLEGNNNKFFSMGLEPLSKALQDAENIPLRSLSLDCRLFDEDNPTADKYRHLANWTNPH